MNGRVCLYLPNNVLVVVETSFIFFFLPDIVEVTNYYLLSTSSIGSLNEHDGIGRVAINLSNLVPDIVHTLTYNIYPSSVVTARKSMGTITVRIKVESVDSRKMLLVGRTNPPRLHINVNNQKSLGVARYTCYGQVRLLQVLGYT